MPDPDLARPGVPVMDREGNLIGVVKGLVGDNYIEIDRNGPNWFVPLDAVEAEAELLRINLNTSQVRIIDLEKQPAPSPRE